MTFINARAPFRGIVAVLALVVFAASASCALPTPLTPRDPAPGASHFTVQTYNIHRHKSGDASTAAAIGAADADVVCLQEVTNAWVSVIRERYAEQYPYMLFAPKENAGGLAVLSHFPLVDRGVLLVPGDLHPGWLLEADAPGGHVQILHVHLRSMFEGWKDPVRNYINRGDDHMTEMNLFFGATREDMPMVVIGDFNEGVKGKTVRYLEGEGYRNALPLFRPGQYTWHAPSVGSTLDMTIDHILFDEHFEPLSAWVENRGASDHLPVVAHLEVRPKEDVTMSEVLADEPDVRQAR